MSRARPLNPQSGILLIDKPQGITSHDAVARTRKAAGTRKVGHAGTLDPMATGLLVLGINSSTRLLTFVVGLDKEYFATVRLGASSNTDDAEGELSALADATAITAEQLEEALAPLRGAVSQVPSSVSAIRIDGKRAYTLAREGETVDIPARDVTISALEVLDTRQAVDGFLDIDIRVECSSGTYIRAIARDLGASLGVGGHLTALRRTRIGPFLVTDASALDTLDVAASLLPPTSVATRLFDRYDLTPGQAIDLGHGKRLTVDKSEPSRAPVAAIAPDGRLIGLVEFVDGIGRPIVNFPPDEAEPAINSGEQR